MNLIKLKKGKKIVILSEIARQSVYEVKTQTNALSVY